MKKLFTGMDRQRQSNPRWPCKEAASCSSLKGQVQEGGAENPRELPEGLGGVTIRSQGPEGSASACQRKGVTRITKHFHSFLQVTVKVTARCQGSWRAETEPVLREWPGRRKLSVNDRGETPGENPPCVVTCGVRAAHWCRMQLLSMDREHGESRGP